MNQTLYINRTLFNGAQQYTEVELLAASHHIIILAEPGAGKTELLKSLATELGVKEKTASVFRQMGSNQIGSPVVIDAFDELAKIGDSGIDELLANISRANPTQVIISSRSSEWSNSATSAFEDFVGHTPLIVRLLEFDESEQHTIFSDHTKKDNFVAFQAEVTRFSLEPLLPNPQFLKLFADAFIESKGCFESKRSIFTQAIAHLAKEANFKTKPNPALPNEIKIELSSEIFAKLLLSGAEGIGISESSEDRMYPLVGSLLTSTYVDVGSILATRLFKPGDNVDQHRPVHKIVAEYCAADYLVKRIVNPSDPLTIEQCLSVIAPNSVVRDELRGLIGWMAALGHKPIQEAALELDPYAVLANGDPSQLEPSSKQLLLLRLKDIEAKDPYFRRGDFLRRFSTAGFFTQAVIEDIKPIITNGSDGHLRDLLLELLTGSQESIGLVVELRQLILATSESGRTRRLAMRCLFELDSYDFRSDLNVLIAEATNSSLNMAADIFITTSPNFFRSAELEVFFRKCISLYPNRRNTLNKTIGKRYFIKRLISCLDLDMTVLLLDSLSKDLACTCGENAYKCYCRTGISKIIGSLLDRYFELEKAPFEPLRVWLWVENLWFEDQKNVKDIISVKLLQEDNVLRQSILDLVFSGLTTREQILETNLRTFRNYYSHSGLCLRFDDYKFIVDMAFENENTELWIFFLERHQFDRDLGKRGSNRLRRHMREQALSKPALMRRWALENRLERIQAKHEDREWKAKNRRSVKRHAKKMTLIHAENIQYVKTNRELVENGQHWDCLVRFAHLVLRAPENIEHEFGDEKLVRNSLKNCLGFIEPEIPNLQRLAELQCDSQYLHAETILFAACLEIMRSNKSLESIKPSLLIALRTNMHGYYSAIEVDELDLLKEEIDRLLFPNIESSEQFLRQYLEPQLSVPKCSAPEVGLLNDEVFSPLRAKLSIEWLRHFDNVEPYILSTLFETAAQYGNRDELNKIIIVRCSLLLSKCPDQTDDKKQEKIREFWFVRAFYFLSLEEAGPYWNWLKLDKKSVLVLNDCSGRMNRNEHPHWPNLTSKKVAAILEGFFDKWPKVHLPSNWGTGDPIGETAYRFLNDIIWYIGDDNPDEAILVLSQLLAEPLFSDIHRELKSIQAEQLNKKALRNFEPPAPHKIVDLLDNNAVVTVEGLRQLVVQELTSYQKDIDGGEFNDANRFYTKVRKGSDIRLGEVDSVEIIASRLKSVLHPQSITIGSEHQTKNHNRIDITAAKMIDGKRRLLVIEAKGQWHPDLYSAASTQLFDRYSIHPDAEKQGIYLVIWFGEHEKISNRIGHGITSAVQLRASIEDTLPPELKGLIDVFVLDVSQN